jgi:hypothetical protein
MIPITTILCGIGWNFNEFREAVASYRYHSNPPAGGSVGGPPVQELKKAKNEKKHKMQSLEAAPGSSPGAAVCTSPAHVNSHNNQHDDECSLSVP